jgi:FkbM family methyltransferase
MLTFRQRLDWLRHFGTACFQQHHLELAPVFQPYLPAGAVVFDVGAHAGQFAKLFSRLAPSGQVYAFEPSPYTLSLLRPVLAWNRIPNVEIVPAGLSAEAGEAPLSTPIKKSGVRGFGLASLAGVSAGREKSDETVPLETLDGFVERKSITRLDFIKADIEGWEFNMLRGGARSIARFKPALYLEISQDALARAGDRPADIWGMLEPLGYAARKAPDFVPVDGFAGNGDYLFTAGEPTA